MGMAMTPTLSHLEPEQISQLDDLGESLDMSRSALVRKAIGDRLDRLHRPGCEHVRQGAARHTGRVGNLADWLNAAQAARRQ
jgi:predicted transcriptional regulator